MNRKVLIGKILVAVLAGVFCISVAAGRSYTDPYGKEWKYKKILIGIEPDGAQETYVIYTNEKNFTYEDVRRGLGVMIMGCTTSANPTPGQYLQFYVVSWERKMLPTPAPAVCYVNKAGAAFVDWEYEVFSNMFQTELFPENYFEEMTREEADELLAMDMICDTFDYQNDLEAFVSKLRLWTDNFQYQNPKKKLSTAAPSPGTMKQFLEKRREEILQRAQEEKKEDFNYYGVKTVHKELAVVSEICIDFKEELWRVQFSDEEDGGYNCYVYIGFDGLTRRVSQEIF